MSACDSSGPDAPAWWAAGQAVAFDYAPGASPLVQYHPRRDIPAMLRAVEMRVLDRPPPTVSRSWGETRHHITPNVEWDLAQSTGEVASIGVFTRHLRFPLDGHFVSVRPDGLHAESVFANRVSERFVPFDPGPDVPRERVETRAGAFDTYVLERENGLGGSVHEFWNREVGLVRVDVLDSAGFLRGRFTRAPDTP